MNADVLKIAIAIFVVGLVTSSLSFDFDRDNELASASPAPLQQGVVVAQVPSSDDDEAPQNSAR